MIDKLKLPIKVGFFRPNLDKMNAATQVAINCAPFAIKGEYKVNVALCFSKITDTSVMTILIPLNCCIKWS